MVRRRRAEVHVNHERWLVSYADFITLLFAFFVVMYSISQVNQSKYRVLSETFTQAFNSPLHPQSHHAGKQEVSIESAELSTEIKSAAESNAIPNASTSKPDPLAEIQAQFLDRFGDLIDEKLVTIASNELWLQIEVKDSILFTSGSAEPSTQARTLFDELALIIREYPNTVQVEGYTDDVPISSARYPSNWELSSARAAAIVKWLVGRGVDPSRLSAAGFGEYQPIANNSTVDGRAQNRRVVLMIARKPVERPGAPVLAPNQAGASDLTESMLKHYQTNEMVPSEGDDTLENPER